VDRVRTQVAEHELQLDLSRDAKELLVDKGWDPAMGARPLRRAIQRYVEDPLADEVLKAGQMDPGSTVQVDRDPKSEPEKVGVGASKKGDGDEEPGDGADSEPPAEDSTK
jgi:ATP-dependent Clp protease ATP-binding subunit ClpC